MHKRNIPPKVREIFEKHMGSTIENLDDWGYQYSVLMAITEAYNSERPLGISNFKIDADGRLRGMVN